MFRSWCAIVFQQQQKHRLHGSALSRECLPLYYNDGKLPGKNSRGVCRVSKLTTIHLKRPEPWDYRKKGANKLHTWGSSTACPRSVIMIELLIKIPRISTTGLLFLLESSTLLFGWGKRKKINFKSWGNPELFAFSSEQKQFFMYKLTFILNYGILPSFISLQI